jgi:hypothetical protein
LTRASFTIIGRVYHLQNCSTSQHIFGVLFPSSEPLAAKRVSPRALAAKQHCVSAANRRRLRGASLVPVPSQSGARRRAPAGDGLPRRAVRSGPARGLNKRPRPAAAMTISPAAVRRAAAAASDRRGARRSGCGAAGACGRGRKRGSARARAPDGRARKHDGKRTGRSQRSSCGMAGRRGSTQAILRETEGALSRVNLEGGPGGAAVQPVQNAVCRQIRYVPNSTWIMVEVVRPAIPISQKLLSRRACGIKDPLTPTLAHQVSGRLAATVCSAGVPAR